MSKINLKGKEKTIICLKKTHCNNNQQMKVYKLKWIRKNKKSKTLKNY